MPKRKSTANQGKTIQDQSLSGPKKQCLTSQRPCQRTLAPFSTDKACRDERARCDYSIKITMEMAKLGQSPRRIRVYADGVYDCFHPGHANQLLQAKNAFPDCDVWLIVGVTNDELTRRLKGPTVYSEELRYMEVRFGGIVDEVLRDAPWVITEEFLNENKIDFVAHDEQPYTSDEQDDIYALVKKKGMFLPTKRTQGISTSDVITHVLKNQDLYTRRNLARGVSAKELNVSFLSEKKYKLQDKMDELKGKYEEKKQEFLQSWEDRTREFIDGFLEFFGREGALNNLWNESRGKIQRALSPPPSP